MSTKGPAWNAYIESIALPRRNGTDQKYHCRFTCFDGFQESMPRFVIEISIKGIWSTSNVHRERPIAHSWIYLEFELLK